MLVLSRPSPGLSESQPGSPGFLPVGLFSRRFSRVPAFLPGFLPGSAFSPGVPPGFGFFSRSSSLSAFSPGVSPGSGLFSRCSSRDLLVRNSSISHKVLVSNSYVSIYMRSSLSLPTCSCRRDCMHSTQDSVLILLSSIMFLARRGAAIAKQRLYTCTLVLLGIYLSHTEERPTSLEQWPTVNDAPPSRGG